MSNSPIILVLDTYQSSYDPTRIAIRDTWASVFRQNGYRIFFYKGNKNLVTPSFEPPDEILLPCDDGLNSTAKKLFLALHYIRQRYSFPFVYRTNLSSFLYFDNFHEHVSSVMPDRLAVMYSGVRGRFLYSELSSIFPPKIYSLSSRLDPFSRSIAFASGSGFFLGSELVDRILENSSLFNLSLIDDVAVGNLLARLGIYPASQSRCDLFDMYCRLTTSSIDSSCFHWRVKSMSRLNDAAIMYFLHQANPIKATESLIATNSLC